LWWLEEARSVIADPAAELFFSVASGWELAIKVSLGKLTLAREYSWLHAQLQANRIRSLAIEPHHCERLLNLPYHHRDPFDRMLVAQALCDGLTLLSRDNRLDSYGTVRIW